MKEVLNVLIAVPFVILASSTSFAQMLGKPTSGTLPQVARGLCENLSAKATKAGDVKTLVIAFEGLASYSATAAQTAYEYHRDLRAGKKADGRPAAGLMGFVSRNVVMPLLEQSGRNIELLIFANDDVSGEHGSTPEVCAKIWMKEPGRKIVIMGHSYGGHASYQLASMLNEDKIKVDAVFTMDPRTKMINYVGWSKPSNVRRWNNFYQRNGFSLPGYPVGSANNTYVGGFVGHTGVPAAPIVSKTVNAYFSDKK